MASQEHIDPLIASLVRDCADIRECIWFQDPTPRVRVTRPGLLPSVLRSVCKAWRFQMTARRVISHNPMREDLGLLDPELATCAEYDYIDVIAWHLRHVSSPTESAFRSVAKIAARNASIQVFRFSLTRIDDDKWQEYNYDCVMENVVAGGSLDVARCFREHVRDDDVWFKDELRERGESTLGYCLMQGLGIDRTTNVVLNVPSEPMDAAHISSRSYIAVLRREDATDDDKMRVLQWLRCVARVPWFNEPNSRDELPSLQQILTSVGFTSKPIAFLEWLESQGVFAEYRFWEITLLTNLLFTIRHRGNSDADFISIAEWLRERSYLRVFSDSDISWAISEAFQFGYGATTLSYFRNQLAFSDSDIAWAISEAFQFGYGATTLSYFRNQLANPADYVTDLQPMRSTVLSAIQWVKANGMKCVVASEEEEDFHQEIALEEDNVMWLGKSLPLEQKIARAEALEMAGVQLDKVGMIHAILYDDLEFAEWLVASNRCPCIPLNEARTRRGKYAVSRIYGYLIASAEALEGRSR